MYCRKFYLLPYLRYIMLITVSCVYLLCLLTAVNFVYFLTYTGGFVYYSKLCLHTAVNFVYFLTYTGGFVYYSIKLCLHTAVNFVYFLTYTGDFVYYNKLCLLTRVGGWVSWPTSCWIFVEPGQVRCCGKRTSVKERYRCLLHR